MIKYVGAVFTLVVLVVALVAALFFLLKMVLIGVVTCLVLAAIAVMQVVRNDWSKIWQPLFNSAK